MDDTPAREATTGWVEASGAWGVDGAADCARMAGAKRVARSATSGTTPGRGGITRDAIVSDLQFASNEQLGYARRGMALRAKRSRAAAGRRTHPARSAAAPRRSRCPVSCTLDVLGDRWTLLVVRDLMRGKRRFAELVDTPEGIPTNILSDRLKRLIATGIVESRRYSEHPPRVEYALTPKGEDLRPVMRAMVEWGVSRT